MSLVTVFNFSIHILFYCCCSVTKLSLILWPHKLKHARLSCLSISPGVCSNSCPLSHWCHPNISFSDVHFSSCPQSFQYQSLFQGVSSLHQVAKVLKLQLVLPINIQGWFPLGFTSLISLLPEGLSRSSEPQFKSINSLVLSLLYDPTLTSIHDYWKNHSFDCTDLGQQSDVSAF